MGEDALDSAQGENGVEKLHLESEEYGRELSGG